MIDDEPVSAGAGQLNETESAPCPVTERVGAEGGVAAIAGVKKSGNNVAKMKKIE